MTTANLLNKAIAVVTGDATPTNLPSRTYQVLLTGTGAITADLSLEVSNNGREWLPFATLSLAGNDRVADKFPATSEAWGWMRANVTSITGVDAAVSVDLSMQ